MEHQTTEKCLQYSTGDTDLSYKTVNVYIKDRDEILYMKPAFLHTKEMPLHYRFPHVANSLHSYSDMQSL